MKPTGSPIAMAPFYSIAWGKSSRNSNWMNFVLVLIRHSFDYDGDDDDEDEKMRCSGNETDPWKEGKSLSELAKQPPQLFDQNQYLAPMPPVTPPRVFGVKSITGPTSTKMSRGRSSNR